MWMLILWIGSVGFSAFVIAFIVALMHPKNALSAKDSAEIRKLVTEGMKRK